MRTQRQRSTVQEETEGKRPPHDKHPNVWAEAQRSRKGTKQIRNNIHECTAAAAVVANTRTGNVNRKRAEH
jgi:hypothetical protein